MSSLGGLIVAGFSKSIDMLEGPLAGKILRFALPLAVTGMFQQLFNAADVAVVGQFASSDAMAAVGCNAPVVGLLVNLFIGVALGANVVIANYTGRGDKEGCSKAMHSALLFAFFAGIILAISGQFFAEPLLNLLGVPENVLPMAVDYIRIYMAGLPMVFMYNFSAAIFRSQGDTRTPLIILIISGCLNVCLNLVFVIHVHMNAAGVSTATTIANTLSTVLLLIILHRRNDHMQFRFKKLGFYPSVLKPIIRIGLPSGLQGMVFSISNICVQSAINSLGSDVMAASSAAFNIEIMSYFIINSFGQAVTTFIGQNYGARKIDRCHRVFKLCMAMGLGVGIAVSLTLLLCARPLLSLFNGDPAIIEIGATRLMFILLPQALSVVMEITSGAMRGYGYSLVPALLVFITVCGVRITWVYTVFASNPTYEMLMLVYPISWILAVIALLTAYLLFVRRLNQGKIRDV